MVRRNEDIYHNAPSMAGRMFTRDSNGGQARSDIAVIKRGIQGRRLILQFHGPLRVLYIGHGASSWSTLHFSRCLYVPTGTDLPPCYQP